MSSTIRFTRIASGLWHACGIVNGTGSVVCWGRDYAGQVSGAPSIIVESLKASKSNRESSSDVLFKEISAGEEHTCASIAGKPGNIMILNAIEILGTRVTDDAKDACIGASRRRRTASHTNDGISATPTNTVVTPPLDCTGDVSAKVQSGSVVCWGNVRTYATFGDMPQEYGKQYQSIDKSTNINNDIIYEDDATNKKDGTLKDNKNLGSLSNSWILTTEGSWFIDPEKGANQIPDSPLLVYSPCTVALVSTNEFNKQRILLSKKGLYVNNTGIECQCNGIRSECGKFYKQCIRPGSKQCELYNNSPPRWSETDDAMWYSFLVGTSFTSFFFYIHWREME